MTAVLVAARYAGVADVLRGLLGAAAPAARAVAVDRDGPAVVDRALAALTPADVLVCTAAPRDDVLARRAARAPGHRDDRLVVVTWHPADERSPLPAAAHLVEAGRIRADLSAAVARAAARVS